MKPTRVSPALAHEHLQLRLRPIDRALGAALERQSQVADALARTPVSELCLTSADARLLLRGIDARLREEAAPDVLPVLSPDERDAEARLQARAADAGVALPFEALVSRFNIGALEQVLLLLCAAVEIDRGYERIIGFILDDLSLRLPCVDLVCALVAGSASERGAVRAVLGPSGLLRRARLVEPWADGATELRQQLRLSAQALSVILGREPPGEMPIEPRVRPLGDRIDLPGEVDRRLVERVGQALRDGSIRTVGVWGPRGAAHAAVIEALSAIAGRPILRIDDANTAEDALRQASVTGALIWLPTDGTDQHDRLAAALLHSEVPVCLAGARAWRSPSLIDTRRYVEIVLPAPSYCTRHATWRRALPELGASHAADLAARFRMDSDELHTIAELSRRSARLAGGAVDGGALLRHVEDACAIVAQKHSARFAHAIAPRRTAADLILPDALHRQVLEIAQFYRCWPRVAETWGFAEKGRSEGLKALFTGEPGTGKTLSAEVIAGVAGVPLHKVDLARVVSKWVGETEKALEAVFAEAEASHAVLFFDEADALFGKRGDVERGSDRYANLEVSYLLQRLEEFDGLAILASNLQDNIDAAFTRRFHVLLHFPRPTVVERRRLWRLALPAAAPLEDGIDLDALARLDMTGASITGAVRTAALLAAHGENGGIAMRHLCLGVARQYQRDARLLAPRDLGSYATLLQDGA